MHYEKKKQFAIIATSVICILAISFFAIANYGSPGPSFKRYTGQSDDIQPGNVNGSANGAMQYQHEETWDFSQWEKDLVNEQHRLIVLKYESRFAHLQAEFQGKINNLLLSARADIERSKITNADLAQLAYRYIREGNALEKDCDKRFYSILGDLEKELRQEGLPLDMVRLAEETYKRQKEQRKDYLTDQAMSYIKGD